MAPGSDRKAGSHLCAWEAQPHVGGRLVRASKEEESPGNGNDKDRKEVATK